MRAFKIVGLVAGALVIPLILGVTAVLILVDPNDYRDDIERRVEAETGRPLRIGGELDLKFFPWLALKVNDLSLGNPPGYGAEPFLTVRHADVGVKLLPLLRKRLEVRRVALDGLEVHLVSRGEEENNWQDLGKSDAEQEPADTEAPHTTIAGLDVTKATLVYRDEAEKSTTRLANLELHTGALASGAPVGTRMEFDYDDGGPRPVAHIVAETQARMPKDTSRIELENLVVKGKWFGSPDGKAAADKSAQPPEFSIRTPALVLDTEAETLAPATFEVTYGELPLRLTAAGEKLFTDRIVTGKIAIDRVSLRRLMPSFGMKVPNTRDPSVLNALAMKSDYRLTEKALQLTDLDLTLDDTRIRGSAAIDDLDTKALSFNLGIDAINVDRYREPDTRTGFASGANPEESSAAGRNKSSPSDLPIEALRELNAHGSLRIGHATLADLKFNDIRLPVDAARGRIVVMPQARLFGGTYNGDIMLDARPAKAKLSLNERVRNIDIGALVNAAFETHRVIGRGDANAVLTGTGNTDAAILASLSGKIAADVKEGAINGVDLWYELRRALALVKRTTPPTRTEPARTQFKTFAGSATLADGILRNDDLRVDMDYVKARGKGTLNITNQVVDYRLVAEIYKLPEEGAGAEMADLKALEIPIAVTGTLADMKVRPDVADLLKARVRKEVEKKVDETKEELKKKLDEKLKDLFNR